MEFRQVVNLIELTVGQKVLSTLTINRQYVFFGIKENDLKNQPFLKVILPSIFTKKGER